MYGVDIRLNELVYVKSVIKELGMRIKSIGIVDIDAQILDPIPSIASLAVPFIATELHDIDRFPGSKHTATYFGLATSLICQMMFHIRRRIIRPETSGLEGTW